jgi:hypothetical protein
VVRKGSSSPKDLGVKKEFIVQLHASFEQLAHTEEKNGVEF